MDKKFVVCIDNSAYPAALELRKLYEVIERNETDPDSHLRVLDESGEDYLYPNELFQPLDLPLDIEKIIDGAQP